MNDELGGFGRKQSWPNKSNNGLNNEIKIVKILKVLHMSFGKTWQKNAFTSSY